MPPLSLSRAALDWITLGAAALAVVGLVLALWLAARLRQVRRDFAVLEGPDGDRQTVVEAMNRQLDELDLMRADVAAAQQALQAARGEVADAIRHVGVVRYDAFADMGGQLSFSVALLDDDADGVLITSINGRSDARTYAKGVTGGRSEQSLSPEEAEVIDLAMGRSVAERRGSQRGDAASTRA